MPAPDLTRVRARVEDLMTDLCRITRDPEGTDDDTLDPSTLTLVPSSGDTATVYEGPCMLGAAAGSLGTAERTMTEGGTNQWARHYTLKVPFSAPVPQAGDQVTILASQDPGMVGLALRVVGSTFGTMKTMRKVECGTRTGGD